MKVSDKRLYNIGYHFLLPLSRWLFRLEIIGKKNIPQGTGVLIMSNHLSYLDPVFLGLGAARELNFMARKDLFRNRLFRALIRELNAFPVERGKADRKALKKALSILEENKALIVFPEGTRGMNDKLGKPEQGAGFLAYWAKCPVIPTYLKGPEIILPKNAKTIQFTKVIVTFGKPVDMDKFQNISNRREIYPLVAQEIMKEIAILKKEIDFRYRQYK